MYAQYNNILKNEWLAGNVKSSYIQATGAITFTQYERTRSTLALLGQYYNIYYAQFKSSSKIDKMQLKLV